MKNKKYKILVLSDLIKSMDSTLKSTISLSNIINADIELFYVKKPIDIIKKENQLTAFRTINQEHVQTKRKLDNLVKSVYQNYGVNIKCTFAFGNIKNQIEEHINKLKPDIIVLGKRKPKTISFLGNNITNFVLSKHEGVVLIASDKNTFEPNDELSLGILNAKEELVNLDFTETLIRHTKKPLKSFRIIKNSNSLKEVNQDSTLPKTVEYVFEENGHTLKNLSNYVSKNNINLLWLDGDDSAQNMSSSIKTSLKDIINNLDVSLLLTRGQKLKIQQNT